MTTITGTFNVVKSLITGHKPITEPTTAKEATEATALKAKVTAYETFAIPQIDAAFLKELRAVLIK